MKFFLKTVPADWPCWLVISFFALLPFGRLAEVPLSIFALSLPFLARSTQHRRRLGQIAPVVIPIFLCFWLPMVVSSIDSYLPEKSWLSSIAALRFLAAALSIALLLPADSARLRVLRWSSFLLLFWALDGFVQLIFGNDLLGIAMHPDRLNALFVQKYQFFGPTLAMLSPLLFEHARRRWPVWAQVIAFTLTFGAVLIAGMRAGWLIMGLVLAIYLWLILKRENRALRKASLSIMALVVTVIISSYLISPLFQSRLDLSLTVAQGSQAALDTASSYRLPIFKTSLKMFSAHPVNGVGVRAFPIAYLDYAEENDPHVQRSGGRSGATHAHNVVLEVLADTGSIGALGMLVGLVLVIRLWRSMSPTRRYEAFPFALALALVFFPLNSHFALFGTYLSSMTWVLFGLWLACIDSHPVEL